MSTQRTSQISFWALTGSIIAVAFAVNLTKIIQSRWRVSRRQTKSRSAPSRILAAMVACSRQIAQGIQPFSTPPSIPSLYFGKVLLVLVWLAAILALCFSASDPSETAQLEQIARRAGNVAIVQLPLVFLLAQKQSLLCYAIGLSYERVYWLHKWIPRIFLITVTIHMSFWFRLWNRTENESISNRLQHDRQAKTGFAAWTILATLTLVSFAPIRKLSYEVFFVLHIALAGGLLAVIYMHLRNNYVYFWISVALVSVDRFIRICNKLWTSSPMLHGTGKVWQDATFEILPGNATRITVRKPLMKWRPGQHTYLSCYRLLPFQSHPFTIASLPSDDKLEIILQPQNGGTKRFHQFATLYQRISDRAIPIKPVAFEGPYGNPRPLLQFDTVVFFAGSTGAAYTVPLLRELLQRYSRKEKMLTTRIRFVWAIKSEDILCWFQDVLERSLTHPENVTGSLKVETEVYVTKTSVSDAPNATEAKPNVVPTTSGLSGNAESALTSSSECSFDEKSLSSFQNKGAQIEPRSLSSSSAFDSLNSLPGGAKAKSRVSLRRGRPNIGAIVASESQGSSGEVAIICCGPRSLQDDVRRSVCQERDVGGLATGKRSGDIYLHAEGFSY